jgi:hypothetical protein
MSAQATTGIGNSIYVGDFRNAVVTISSASSANFTIKCVGGISQEIPDFTATASTANPWTFVQMVDLNDGLPVTGSTGVVATGTDIVRTFEVNVNALQWINFNITARSAGNVTVIIQVTDNN